MTFSDPPITTHSTAQISQPSYIIPCRTRRPTKPPPRTPTTPCANSLSTVWSAVESSILSVVNSLLQPTVSQILTSLRHATADAQLPAACLTMGTGAAAGDRPLLFSAVTTFVRREFENVVHLSSATHPSFSAILTELSAIPSTSRLVVAVEDAEAFPETTLRDLVYYCAKRRPASSSASSPVVSLLLGMSTESSIHSALGVDEATLIATSAVSMPPPGELFSAIVAQVLSLRSGVLLSKAVFQVLETQFFAHQPTITTLIRSLKTIYTLHFYRMPLAFEFCQLENQCETDETIPTAAMLQPHFSTDLLEALRHHVASVTSATSPLSNVDMRNMCAQWSRNMLIWKLRCHLLQETFIRLFEVCQVPEREWNDYTPFHSQLQVLLFKMFLVDNTLTLAFNPVMTILTAKIKVASRILLRQIAKSLREHMQQSSLATLPEEANILGLLEVFEHDLLASPATPQPAARASSRLKKSPAGPRARGGAAARLRRQQLLMSGPDAANSTAPKKNGLQAMRSRLQSIIVDLINFAAPLHMLPLHEVFLFNSASDLQKYNGGMSAVAEPRHSFFSAMRQPNRILGATASVPDTAAAFQLLAEGGKLVSLYDWYNSFAATVMAGQTKRDEQGNLMVGRVSTAELQARFARCCSELEFLGVIKYTNRKTDHVVRLAHE